MGVFTAYRKDIEVTADPQIEQVLALARTGDPAALKIFAGMTFRQAAPGATFADGAQAYELAAAQGDGEAAYHLSAVISAGAGVPKDWRRAMDLLGAAAAGGWEPARRQVAVLTAQAATGRPAPDPVSDAADWRAAAAAIDLDRWLRPPPGVVFSQSPHIRVFAEFIPEPLCGLVIESARGKLAAAPLYAADEHGNVVGGHRNNRAAFIDWMEGGVAVNIVRERMAAALAVDTSGMENLSVLNYRPGERFLPHYDFLDETLPGHATAIALYGQRIATFLVTLNDAYEEGGTYFTALGQALRGGTGDGICFLNVGADGKPDLSSQHAGLPPTSGEKWIISQFVRAPPRAP